MRPHSKSSTAKPIPYGRQSITNNDVEAVTAQMVTDWLTTGPKIDEFERHLSGVTGGHSSVAVSSGTAALHCAYAALDLQPGDEVITSPITFVSTAATAIKEGAKVVFADVDPITANIDSAKVQEAISSHTRAIVAVDYAGNPADYELLRAVASSAGVALIADASHSLGGSLDGQPVGDLADMSTLSFFPTKNITTGEGGAVICKDEKFTQRVREFRTHGLVRDRKRQILADEGPWHQEVQEFGLNYRLTDIQAALGLSQLTRLNEFLMGRQQIVNTYNEAFSNDERFQTPGVTKGAKPAWHIYPLRVRERSRRALYESLRAKNILAQVNYLPVYWHPAFERLGYRRGLCPNAEKFYSCEISLPLFFDLSVRRQEEIIEIVLTSVD